MLPVVFVDKKKVLLKFLRRRRRQFRTAGIWIIVIYFLFYCPVTRPTWEGLIDLLSNRNPPAWLMPTVPGQKTDIEQTKVYKRQKLAQFKVKVNFAFKTAVGIKAEGPSDPAQANKTTWQNFRFNISAAGNTFVDFWGVSIITYQDQTNQEQTIIVGERPISYQDQTVVVGETSKTINLNDRVLRWQREIEASAKKYSLEPALIAAVIEQESGGDPDSISPVGAAGLMQLMPSTAKFLKVNPYDPAQNIDGGAHYLQMQLKQFGTIPEALAAYNAGPGNVQNNAWSNIPETLNYVQKIPRLMSKYERLWNGNR